MANKIYFSKQALSLQLSNGKTFLYETVLALQIALILELTRQHKVLLLSGMPAEEMNDKGLKAFSSYFNIER